MEAAELDTLSIALGYAQRGLHVFPARHRNKTPLTSNGFFAASADPDVIRAMFDPRLGPRNIALRTGIASRLFVVDIDLYKEGAAEALASLLAEIPELNSTVQVQTGGGGLHYYLSMPAGHHVRNSVTKLGTGIDVRAEGGYVIAPGSVHASGQSYSWVEGRSLAEVDLVTLPEKLVDRLCKSSPSSSTAPQRESREPSPLDKIKAGERNDSLFRQACSLRRTLDADEVRDVIHRRNEERCVPPLPREEVDRLVNSALGYDSADTHPCTHYGNARRLVDRYGAEVRFVPERGVWRIWTGTHWGDDVEGRIYQMMKAIACSLVSGQVEGAR